ncbi:hypothetical protein KOXY103107_07010 [Komagataeibacter xylinus]
MMQTASEPASVAKPDTVQATARLMQLEAGLYCLFHAALSAPMHFGKLTGMRVSAPPGMDGVRVSTFDAQGWIGASTGQRWWRCPQVAVRCWSPPIASLMRPVNCPPCRLSALAARLRPGLPPNRHGWRRLHRLRWRVA